MEEDKIILSVIIPTYNRSELLNYTLKSIKSQTIDLSAVEILVVDDGSSDNSAAIVASYADALNIRYFFQPDEGYRVASARNLGVINSLGEIITFIDSGITLDPDCLSEHLAIHLGSEINCIVIGYVLGIEENYDPEEVLLKQIDLGDPRKTIKKFTDMNKYLDIREEVYQSCQDDLMKLKAPWAMFWTGNASVKKIEIERVDFFDTIFDKRWGVEDIDLGYRMFKNGLPIILNRKASGIHCPHYSYTEEKLKQEYINKQYFHSKHNVEATKIFLKCTAIELNNEMQKKQL